jgi:prolyl-tRNA editing enzyme YbaK/EbsC (Cys-tRNA(Pro) deacylase)
MQTWLDYLNDKGVHYSWSMHRPAETALDTAHAECMPASEFAKVVVYSGETGFGMAVVPADRLADLREIAYLLGDGTRACRTLPLLRTRSHAALRRRL